MVVSNGNLLFQWSIFRGYVSFKKGTISRYPKPTTNLECYHLPRTKNSPGWAGSAEKFSRPIQPVELLSAKVEITLPYLTTKLFGWYFLGVLVFCGLWSYFEIPQGRSISRGYVSFGECILVRSVTNGLSFVPTTIPDRHVASYHQPLEKKGRFSGGYVLAT